MKILPQTAQEKKIHAMTKGNKNSSLSSSEVMAESESKKPMDVKKANEIKNDKITMKDFVKSGNFLEDEVKRRAEKGSPHFFDKDTMRFFSSRVSELMWKKGSDIYFITSEQDKGTTQHAGSTRAFTVRKIDADGDINKIGEFQGHATLSDARREIKDIIGLGDN